jgi:hypothetical protein
MYLVITAWTWRSPKIVKARQLKLKTELKVKLFLEEAIKAQRERKRDRE